MEDDETLYRRITYKPDHWHMDDTGELRVTHTAFSDPQNKPSVDRARLCSNNPSWTQQDDERNGVVFLLAHEVRAIADIITNSNPPIKHQIDVIHVPEEDNHAHAQIEPAPVISSKGTFRRLRVSLAFLANRRGWLIKPLEYRG
ncbi:MAG: hypothetical protein IT328_02175 [Caldilineaceae bacterium]|nr:hypothetical protein [Caldilineaceae bacterium]